MIHLCTIATLMFLQNNTSQKILFIAARTIQFPGVVFKVCIYLIVAIVTSSIYFDVKSSHTYRKYIYQQSKMRIIIIITTKLSAFEGEGEGSETKYSIIESVYLIPRLEPSRPCINYCHSNAQCTAKQIQILLEIGTQIQLTI